MCIPRKALASKGAGKGGNKNKAWFLLSLDLSFSKRVKKMEMTMNKNIQ